MSNFQYYDTNFHYNHIQRYLPTIGKWVKSKWMEEYGIEPRTGPHQMVSKDGKLHNCEVFYYPDTWLKKLFEVY